MGWELLLLGLIGKGVNGYYSGKGTNQKGTFIGGKMSGAKAEQFAKDKKLAAAGDADAQKRMEAAAAKANADRLAGGGAAKTEPKKPAEKGNTGVMSTVDATKKLDPRRAANAEAVSNAKSFNDIKESDLNQLGSMDVAVWDALAVKSGNTTVKAAIGDPWNEYHRQVDKRHGKIKSTLDDFKDEMKSAPKSAHPEIIAMYKKDIDANIGALKGTAETSVAAAGRLSRLTSKQLSDMAAKGTTSQQLKNNPKEFFRQAQEYYGKGFPKFVDNYTRLVNQEFEAIAKGG